MGKDIAQFQAINVSRRAHEMKAAGTSVLHMEFGQPSTGAPAGAIARAHEVLDTEAMGYWESMPLKQRLCQHYKESYDVLLSPDRIAITCGASPALVLALAGGFDPGAHIAMARPGYVAYRNTVAALNLQAVEIACTSQTGFQLTAAALDALDPVPQGVILASPANPTGTVIPGRELAEIARLCREKRIRIISDEIYHGLSYGPRTHSILEFEEDAYVISSFSKYFSMAGWRLGWLVSPPSLARRSQAYIGNLFLTAPSLAQHAGLAALDSRAELDRHVEIYRRNRDLLLQALPGFGLDRIAPPDGAFYIYADVSDLTNDSLAFCMRLLEETGVATAPGTDFDPVDGHGFIRLSFALSTPETEEAIRRIGPWLERQRRAALRS